MNTTTKHKKLFIVLLSMGLLIVGVLIIVSVRGVLVARDEGIAVEPSQATNGGSTLKIMSYNWLWHQNTPERGGVVADYIVNHNIELIGFQETPAKETSTKFPGYEILQDALEERGLNYDSRRDGDGDPIMGNSIFSKYPIEDYHIEEFEFRNDGEDKTGKYQIFKINYEGEDIRIANIHLPSNSYACRTLETVVNNMKSYLEQNKIIMGDFNLSPLEECMQNELLAGYNSACLVEDIENGCHNSVNYYDHPQYAPGGRIDHIMLSTSSTFYILDAFVDQDNLRVSDHLPVVAELGLNPNAMTSYPSPAPTTQGIQTAGHTKYDLNNDQMIDIFDFVKFAKYYVVEDLTIDYNEDGSRDVGDFTLFAEAYRIYN